MKLHLLDFFSPNLLSQYVDGKSLSVLQKKKIYIQWLDIIAKKRYFCKLLFYYFIKF